MYGCSVCGGNGYTVCMNCADEHDNGETCPDCTGTGHLCEACLGKGFIGGFHDSHPHLGADE